MFELPGGLTPLPHLADPPTSGQNSTPGGRVSTPHLSFAESDNYLLPKMRIWTYLPCLRSKLIITFFISKLQRRQSGLKSGGRGSRSKNFDFLGKFRKNFDFFAGNLTKKIDF